MFDHPFDVYLPLPFRITALVIAGFWGWGLNAMALKAHHVDLGHMLHLPPGTDNLADGVFQFATVLTIVWASYLGLFWIMVWQDGARLSQLIASAEVSNQDSIVSFQFLDGFAWGCLGIVVFLAFVYRRRYSPGRQKLLHMLSYIARGKIDLDNRLADTLLSDALTSYSKVFVDTAISTCILVHDRSCLVRPDRHCGGEWLVPLVTCIPFLIRLNQCLYEWKVTNNKLHLMNMAKYATSLPVIFMSAMQRNRPEETEADLLLSPRTLFNVWVLFIFINSSYSFYWDVRFDWGLSLLNGTRITHSGLRPITYFPRAWYFVAIALDSLLRFSWSLKLSSHWYQLSDHESGIFVLELLEIVRRWVWIFFRVENEWAATNRDLHISIGK